jgi:uncharacterized protein (TIGR02646 family)
MIFVDRSKSEVPKALLSSRAKKARAAAESFFAIPRKRRLQQRFDFDSTIWMEARSDLANLFGWKCAFCETPIEEVININVEHFRPKLSVSAQHWSSRKSIELFGRPLPDGYWWLAYTWDNLYLICSVCNRNRGNSFPIDGSPARPRSAQSELALERPLLLDPCLDHPERFLHFQKDGTVIPRKLALSTEKELTRAKATIAIFGLNRNTLIERRRLTATEVLHTLKQSRNAIAALKQAFSEALLLSDNSLRPFLAVRYDTIRDWTTSLYKRLNASEKHELINSLQAFPELGEVSLPPGMEGTFLESISRDTHGDTKAKTKLAPPKSPRVIGRGGYIEWVEIRNFKAISDLRINFPHGSSERMGWKVLLGENGAGKSSVLQAVALALLGPHASNGLLKPKKLLRRLPGRNKRAEEGIIRVQLSKAPHPVELRFNAKTYDYSESSHPPIDLLFRAYGATRLLPRHRRRAKPKDAPVSTAANLFNPFIPVCDANAWLANLRTKESFASAALSLKDLLRIPNNVWLHRERGKVIVPLNGVKITLDELSAGYESILVLAVDIMSAVHGTQHDLSQTGGIVLLDEIDAHLHPRWKMEIVPALRRCFPNIQFLVTTHEPLCLRGLQDGEISLMHREAGEILVDDDLPSPVGLRVDQLLTSQFFGLHSTIDPALDAKFVEYYALLTKRDQDLSPQQRQRRDTLKKELSVVGALGHTRRDQLVYEAVDEYLAKEPLFTLREERVQLKATTKRKIAQLLSEASTSSESPA